MYTIATVADLIHISASKPTVIAADVDHTLVDFDAGHEAGIKAIAKITDPKFAKRVDEIFQFLVLGNRTSINESWADRERHDALVASFIPHQAHDLKKYGNRKWSRETWMMIAALELGYEPTQAFLTKVRDTYWDAVAEHALLFPEAPEFFAWLKREKIVLIAMTGSDSVVNITQDTPAKLVYEPTASWDYKMKRLGKIPAHKILIGDPHDKPHQEFFNGVYRAAQEFGAQSPAEVWFVGDSKGGDLDVPEKDGYPTFLVKREKLSK